MFIMRKAIVVVATQGKKNGVYDKLKRVFNILMRV
jgi:hypothetical protein